MDLLVNDLSVHGQFESIEEFRGAISRLIAMRKAAQSANREVLCHGEFLSAQPMRDMTMQQAVGRLERENKMAVMAWFNNAKYYWDEDRQHDSGDYLDSNDEVVTDTAVGEAAYRKLHSMDAGLISLSPSDWSFSPIPVTWYREAEGLGNKNTELDNWWDIDDFQTALQDTAPPIQSWGDLHQASTSKFTNLTIADNCFEPLAKVPFTKSAAYRFMELLNILDQLSQAFDNNGKRTKEGDHLYKTYFEGRLAWFSDSKDHEKHEFRNQMTFPNPEDQTKTLFCPWHGKVKRQTPLRMHFFWTMRKGDPVYVVYAGHKITMV